MVERWHIGGIVVAALGSFACSDPVPPPAQASLTFSVVPSGQAPAGTQCITSSDTASIGEPPSQISPPEPGGRIVDGEDDQEVSCTIRGSGPFSVSASMDGRNTHPSAQFPNSLVSFAIQDGDVPSGDFGSGLAAIFTSSLAVTLQSDPEQPCTIQAFDAAGENNGLVVKEGAMFARINCPALIDVRTPSTFCAGQGVIVLENCLVE